MTIMNSDPSLWFMAGGADYARFRPQYPIEVLRFLKEIAPNRHYAVDIGCGTGQLTQLLSVGFDRVTGIDPSQSQIENTQPNDRTDYRVAPAEHLPHDLHNVSIITVAQAAHWFDLPVFYLECERIAAPGAVIALISYGVIEPDTILRSRFMQFYTDEIASYWPPERRHVDQGYREIYFPFQDISAPAIHITLEWDLSTLMGYLSTWTAVKQAVAAGQSHLLTHLYEDLRQLWGDPLTPRLFTWPINIRAGKL